MAMGGQAPMAMAIMWILTAVTSVMVLLRVYTRIMIVQKFGADDYVYVFSGFMLFFYSIFLQISSGFGFGQPVLALPLDDAVHAVEWEMIGQTFAVVGMATAKVSLGLFLLRIVVEAWQKIALWVASVLTLAVSLVVAVLFWTQCRPIRSLYDPRVEGTCFFGIAPFSLMLGVVCIIADFFFAAFPWLFIWNLKMKYKEKVIISASLSLGVIAGAAGIVRTVSLGGIASINYTEDTVPLIIWSAVELSVTMICAGIPVFRPLYRRITGGLTSLGSNSKSASSTSGYLKHGTGNDTRSANINLRNMTPSRTGDFPDAHPKLGIRGATTVTYIKGDNHSDEEILGWEFRQGQRRQGGNGDGRRDSEGRGGTQVREHVDVTVETVGGKGSRSRGELSQKDGQSQRDGASAEEMV